MFFLLQRDFTGIRQTTHFLATLEDNTGHQNLRPILAAGDQVEGQNALACARHPLPSGLGVVGVRGGACVKW